MSFYFDLGTLLPELSIFIFQGFQKLSEGEVTISAGEHKRWNRSRPKIKSVLVNIYIYIYICSLFEAPITIYFFVAAKTYRNQECIYC